MILIIFFGIDLFFQCTEQSNAFSNKGVPTGIVSLSLEAYENVIVGCSFPSSILYLKSPQGLHDSTKS